MLRRNRDRGGGRTAEERARAAAERAARRAQREGVPVEPPPPEAFEHEVAPPDLAPGEPPAAGYEPEPAPEPEWSAEPVDEPSGAVPFEVDPHPAAEPEPAGDYAHFVPDDLPPEPQPEPPQPEPEPKPEPKPDPEPPEPEPDPEPPEAELHEPEIPAVGDPEPPPPPPPVPPPQDTEEFAVEDALAAEPEPIDLPPSQPGRPSRTPRRAGIRRPPRPPKPPRTSRGARVPRARRGGGGRNPRPVRATGSGGRWSRRIGALLVFAVIIAFGYAVNETFQPLKGDPEGVATVRVPQGASVGDIGTILADNDVIDSDLFFEVNATLTGRRDGLRPGNYTLPKGMTNAEALEALQDGPRIARRRVKTFKLTLAEGRSRREVARLLEKEVDSLEGDYLKATSNPSAQTLRRLGAPRATKTLEGYLFPATYELPVGAPMESLVTAQVEGFRDRTESISYTRAKRAKLTRYDVLIIASMIEREAQLDKERPLIAAVIYNRLKAGMPLGIDATIRYELDNYTRPLRQSELARDTPYNTRINRGLPPTPIGNPGLASLRAAARPARKRYLYFVVKPGTCGEHAFSSTEAKFQADSRRYENARARKGGQSPDTC